MDNGPFPVCVRAFINCETCKVHRIETKRLSIDIGPGVGYLRSWG